MAEAKAVTLTSPSSGRKYVVTMSSKLGSGSAAIVRRAETDVTKTVNSKTVVSKEVVAVKLFKEFFTHSDFIQEEIQVMRTLSAHVAHPNILQLLDVAQSFEAGAFHGPRNLVLDMCDHSLWTMARYATDLKDEYRPHPKAFKLELTRQLLSGLAFIHNNNISHGDIHCGNVLVHKASGMVKFCDFGSSEKEACPPTSDNIRSRFIDLRDLAMWIILPQWCGEEFGFYSMEASQYVKSEGVHPQELVDQASGLISTSFGILSLLMDEEDPNWYGNESNEMKTCIHDLLEYHFSVTEDKELGSHPVPVGLRRPLELCLLFGEVEHLSAPYASGLVETVVSPEQRDEGMDYIRNWSPPEGEEASLTPQVYN
eukprot:scpid73729/ scgid31385/ Glycogen synthase kinase-3